MAAGFPDGFYVPNGFYDADSSESLLKKDLRGKIAIVTGANSGIGLSLSEQLVNMGATVAMGCRSVKKCEEARGTFDLLGGKEHLSSDHAVSNGKAFTGGKAICLRLDLSDLGSVREFATEVQGRFQHVDYLVNNAGLVGGIGGRTKQGLEMNFGVMYVGHFLLTKLLMPPIQAIPEEAGGADSDIEPARIVNHASAAMTGGYLHESLFTNATGEGDLRGEITDGCPLVTFEDWRSVRRLLSEVGGMSWRYNGPCPVTGSYSRAKFAQVLYTRELQNRLDRDLNAVDGKVRPVIASSLHPGSVQSGMVRVTDVIVRPTLAGAVVLLHCLFSYAFIPGSFVDEMLLRGHPIGHPFYDVGSFSFFSPETRRLLVTGKFSWYAWRFGDGLGGRSVQEAGERLWAVSERLVAEWSSGIDGDEAGGAARRN